MYQNAAFVAVILKYLISQLLDLLLIWDSCSTALFLLLLSPFSFSWRYFFCHFVNLLSSVSSKAQRRMHILAECRCMVLPWKTSHLLFSPCQETKAYCMILSSNEFGIHHLSRSGLYTLNPWLIFAVILEQNCNHTSDSQIDQMVFYFPNLVFNIFLIAPSINLHWQRREGMKVSQAIWNRYWYAFKNLH